MSWRAFLIMAVLATAWSSDRAASTAFYACIKKARAELGLSASQVPAECFRRTGISHITGADKHRVAELARVSEYPAKTVDELRLPDGPDDDIARILREHLISDALHLIQMLSHNGYKRARCATGNLKRLPQTNKWEERRFCLRDVGPTPCLVYSVGTNGALDWEKQVVLETGCEVHAFDPTVEKQVDTPDGVFFHKLGLQGSNTDISREHSGSYKAKNASLLMPLPALMKKLGHQDRKLEVLMMDCEGCEWGVLEDMCNTNSHQLIKQLVLELHFQKNMGVKDEEDILRLGRVINCLERNRWFQTSFQTSGANPIDWDYAPGVVESLPSAGHIQYVSMRQFGENEKLPGTYMREYGLAEVEVTTYIINQMKENHLSWQAAEALPEAVELRDRKNYLRRSQREISGTEDFLENGFNHPQ